MNKARPMLGNSRRTHNEFLYYLRERTANTSGGASTARALKAGKLKQAKRYLAQHIDLRKLSSVRDEKQFRQLLNKATRGCAKSMGRKKVYWGYARKVVNLYLRKAVYDKYLCESYRLSKLEPWLEIPLDSYVARGLRGREKEIGGNSLPRTFRIKDLDAQMNNRYQRVASQIAQELGTYRIHLDLKYWRR